MSFPIKQNFPLKNIKVLPFIFLTTFPILPTFILSPTFGNHQFVFYMFIFCFRFYIYVRAIIQYLSFSVLLTSLSIVPSRSTHVAANGKISFSLSLNNISLCVYTTFSLSIHLYEHLACFHVLLLLLLLSRFSRVRLFNPIDSSPPGSLPCPWDSPGENTGVGRHFLLQCTKVKSLSRVWLLAAPWTAAHQAPLSMGFSRQAYWSGVPLPSPIPCLSYCK